MKNNTTHSKPKSAKVPLLLAAFSLLLLLPTACQVVQESVVYEDEPIISFSVDFPRYGIALGTTHSFEADLRVDSPFEIDCDSFGFDPEKFDVWMRSMSENNEQAGVYARCSDQPGCTINVEFFDYSSLEGNLNAVFGSRCHWAVAVSGFHFDEEGSVFPTLLHEEDEFQDPHRSDEYDNNLKIRKIEDLKIFFDKLDNFNLMQGTIGVLHAAFVDENGDILIGGNIEIDLEDSLGLEPYTDLYATTSNTHLENYSYFTHVALLAQIAGNHHVDVIANTSQEQFVRWADVHIYEPADISGVRFYEVTDINSQPLLYGINLSLLPVPNDELHLEAETVSWGDSPLEVTKTRVVNVVAMLISQDGDPVLPSHLDGVQHTIQYGSVLDYTFWNDGKYAPGITCKLYDGDGNVVTATPDIWSIVGYEEGTTTMGASWGGHEATLSVEVTAP